MYDGTPDTSHCKIRTIPRRGLQYVLLRVEKSHEKLGADRKRAAGEATRLQWWLFRKVELRPTLHIFLAQEDVQGRIPGERSRQLRGFLGCQVVGGNTLTNVRPWTSSWARNMWFENRSSTSRGFSLHAPTLLALDLRCHRCKRVPPPASFLRSDPLLQLMWHPHAQ